MLMKYLKKVAVSILCISMVFASTACGSGEEGAKIQNAETQGKTSDSAGGDAGILNEAGVYPIVKEPITLKMMIMAKPYIEDYNTNDFTKYIEDLTGINLEIEAVDYENFNEKINLAISGGDYPDIIMSFSPDVVKYGVGEQIFIPIEGMIEENMPNYMEKMKDYIKLTEQSDGHIYGVAAMNEALHMMYSDKLWANTWWIDQLGKEMPTTTDELYELCEAFLKKNPQGVCFADTNTGLTINWVMNSYILTPNDNSSKVRCIVSPDGKIISAANQNEYKEGLKFLRKLYDLGALYDGNFSGTEDSLKSLINQEGEPVLFFPRNYSGAHIDAAASNELYRHYDVLPPVAGPEGTRQTPYYKYDSVFEERFVITDKCENPEAALRLCDWFFGEKSDLIAEYGSEEGTDWIWKPEGMVGVNGKPALYKILNAYSTDVQNHDWQVTGSMYAPSDYRLGVAAEKDVDIYTKEALEKYLYDITMEKSVPYAQKEGTYDVLPKLHMTEDEKEQISVPLVETSSYIIENTIAFVTGKKDIDKEWDSYVKEFDNIGLPTILEVYQAAYDRSTEN